MTEKRIIKVKKCLEKAESTAYANQTVISKLKQLISLVEEVYEFSEQLSKEYLECGPERIGLDIPNAPSTDALGFVVRKLTDIMLDDHFYDCLDDSLSHLKAFEDEIETEKEMCKLIMERVDLDLTE